MRSALLAVAVGVTLALVIAVGASDSGMTSSPVIGYDGAPIIYPGGEPLVGDSAPIRQPSSAEAHTALPVPRPHRRAVFNEYTGRFDSVDSVTATGTFGQATTPESLVYICGPNNVPKLAVLSRVDPQAADRWHKEMAAQVRDSAKLSGLGQDPATLPPAGG